MDPLNLLLWAAVALGVVLMSLVGLMVVAEALQYFACMALDLLDITPQPSNLDPYDLSLGEAIRLIRRRRRARPGVKRG